MFEPCLGMDNTNQNQPERVVTTGAPAAQRRRGQSSRLSTHDDTLPPRREAATGYDATGGETLHATLDWWTATLPLQAIPAELPGSRTRAVDGTDWESAGRFRADVKAEYDGDAPVDTDHDPADHVADVTKTRKHVKRAGKWEIGPDCRAIHTTDRDARAGYRTTTAGRKGGMYIGSEVLLVVQTSDFTWSGDVTRVNEGPAVPGFMTGAVMAAAGSHRSKTVMPLLTDVRQGIKTVVWDRGYSMQEFKNAHGPPIAAGIDAIFDLSVTQRANPPSPTRRSGSMGTPSTSTRPHASASSNAPRWAPPPRSAANTRRSSTSAPPGAGADSRVRTATASPGGSAPSTPAA